MTKVLICGGRKYYNKMVFKRVMDQLHEELQFTLVIQGEADGADRLAKYWAASTGIKCEGVSMSEFPGVGGQAGSIRNLAMLVRFQPDMVVAFPGGHGTADMVRQARERGVKRVIEVEDKT